MTIITWNRLNLILATCVHYAAASLVKALHIFDSELFVFHGQLIERVLMVSGGNLECAMRIISELQFVYDGSNSSHVPNDTNLSEKVLKGMVGFRV